jgi:hypothetical protein
MKFISLIECGQHKITRKTLVRKTNMVYKYFLNIIDILATGMAGPMLSVLNS